MDTLGADLDAPTTAPHRFRLGQFDLMVVNDGDYTAPAAFLAVNAPPQDLTRELAAMGQAMDAYRTTINDLLIDTGDHRVLVDTGFGASGRAFYPDTGKLLPTLRVAGIGPDAVDTVILTHLHGDHIGGALDAEGRPAFPNARYLISQAEYDFWWGEPDLAELPLPEEFRQVFRAGAKGTLVALQGQLEQVEPDMEVVPGVRLVAAYGHTPGHVAVEVSSGGETLLHVVDAAGDPILHLRHPDWYYAPDNWPEAEVRTRRRLFDRAANEGLLVLAHHFPFPGLGHVAKDGDGWRWQPVA